MCNNPCYFCRYYYTINGIINVITTTNGVIKVVTKNKIFNQSDKNVALYSNMTSFFRFVNKRAIYRLGIISLAHAPVHTIKPGYKIIK
jgi:hypothetical protein